MTITTTRNNLRIYIDGVLKFEQRLDWVRRRLSAVITVLSRRNWWQAWMADHIQAAI